MKIASLVAAAALTITCATSAFAAASPGSEKGTEPPPPRRVGASVATTPSSLVDLNAASRDQLAALRGLGAADADRIIAGRPYARKEDLLSRGILTRRVYRLVQDRVTAKPK